MGRREHRRLHPPLTPPGRAAPQRPVLPSLRKNRGFTSGLVLGLIFYAAVAGLLLVLSLYLQDALHRTPAQASLGLAPIAAGIIRGLRGRGRPQPRRGRRRRPRLLRPRPVAPPPRPHPPPPTRRRHSVKPIGFWLNRTDQALTATMNALLAEYGLTRLAWQVLNVVADDPQATDTTVRTVLAANASPAELTAAVTAVLTDGWATRPAPEHLVLTDAGRTRLALVGERVAAFRQASTAGITPEEYRTAVSVLERMTRNLTAGQDH
ncbi:MarR family winged helix-turn-helix transcriptional regulator [Kitasatospora sp. NPDC090091]|uniref:MarR family winged helix-turn-helix transcriptional regulator n=1 Tax=Kitasatospora sp. NPDC090091 TaxID=3364081 RepID=UPI003817B749